MKIRSRVVKLYLQTATDDEIIHDDNHAGQNFNDLHSGTTFHHTTVSLHEQAEDEFISTSFIVNREDHTKSNQFSSP